jgi:hypothetical protein
MGRIALAGLPFFVMGGLIAAMLVSIEFGYRTGLRRRARSPETTRALSPVVKASVFGLMGLLIAFTFAGAGVRFDNRRMLIAEEANAIEKAYFRLDLLPPESQPQLREDFRAYVRGRLAVTRNLPNMEAVNADLKQLSTLQGKIWEEAADATKGSSSPATQMLVLSALNEMMDAATRRTVGIISHLPLLVWVLLVLTVLLGSFLTGYSMSMSRARDWLSGIIFAIVISSAIYVTFDYEYPRAGLIRVDVVDQLLVQTLERMEVPVPTTSVR